MATVHSLVCWGGRTGKTVVPTHATGIFTLTNHGNKDGSKRWITGALPTGLSAAVPYYTKSLTANTFELYTNAALTSKATFTSSPSTVLKSDFIIDTSVLAAYGVDITRYGTSGAERIYDGFYAASATRSSVGLGADDEVIEFGEAFAEFGATLIPGSGFSQSYTFVSTINGIRTPAFHFGIPSAGHTYTATGIVFYTSQINVVVDGLDLIRNSASGGVNDSVCSVTYGGNVLCNCIVRSIGAGITNGIYAAGTLARVYNNLVIGICPGTYTVGGIAVFGGALVYNNTVTKCGVGFIGYSSGSSYGQTYNNLSVGNDVNWKGAPVYTSTRSLGNIGEVADLKAFTVVAAATALTFSAAPPVGLNQQVFLSSTGTLPSVGGTPLRTDVGYYVRGITGATITLGTAYNASAMTFSGAGSGTHTLSTVWANAQPPDNYIDFSDPSLVFADWTNNDLRPAGASHTPAAQALMVDTAVYLPVADISVDILGKEKPNYNGGGAEAKDVGCFEYDHGYGPRPASHVLTLDNVVVGSRVVIRDQAKTVVHFEQFAAGSTVTATVTVYGDARDNWLIDIRQGSTYPYYQRYKTLMTATPGASSLFINQLPDQR